MAAQTYLFPCLNDNFGVLLHDPVSGATAAIDAPEAAPHAFLVKFASAEKRPSASRGWSIDYRVGAGYLVSPR